MTVKARTQIQRDQDRKKKSKPNSDVDVLPSISPPSRKELAKAAIVKAKTIKPKNKDISPSKASLEKELQRLRPLEVSALYEKGWWEITIFTDNFSNFHAGKKDRSYFIALQKAIDQVHKDAESGIKDETSHNYGRVGNQTFHSK